MSKHHHVKRIVPGIVVGIAVVVCVVFLLYRNTPVSVNNDFFSFSAPRTFSVEMKESSDHGESILWKGQAQAGGVTYYPSLSWEEVSGSLEAQDSNIEALLQSEGFLRPGEKFDAYMMECGLHLTADLSESRDGVERMHYFYFTTSGHCYDLWFCDDIVSGSEAEQIKDTFQLEASV